MTDYQKYINALRKCAKEHENDRAFTGHIRVSDLCQDTANLLETIERESDVLDKIRAEIKALSPEPTAEDVIDGNPIKDAIWENLCDVLKIIDKYRTDYNI